MHNSFTYKDVEFSCRELKLRMKKTWQTSHSSSQERNNFLVKITYDNKIGIAEAGLPPKKPGCYLADTSDCMNFFVLLGEKLNSGDFAIDTDILEINDLFLSFRNDENKDLFIAVLSALHSFQ